MPFNGNVSLLHYINMKTLDQFVNESESRRILEAVKNEGETVEQKAKIADKKVGKKAEANGSKGVYAIDEPYEDGAVEPLTKEQLNKNMKLLLKKIKTEAPFFILGEAGWGKTSIIKDMARRYGRAVITVYLDKAVASDLGGIPIPTKTSRGKAKMEYALPEWAAYMLEHDDKKFLLFFDEMNQAAPDVMNALMPIVLESSICGIKFDNFIVGAAGNFAYENSAVSELNGPLESRFKPIIVWKSGGEEEWKNAFNYLHKKWDDKLTPELIDKFAECSDMFVNPREVDLKIFRFIYKMKQDPQRDWFDADDYKDELNGLTKKDLTKHQREEVDTLAEVMYNFINDIDTDGGGRRNRRGGVAPLTEQVKKMAYDGMKKGYMVVGNAGKDIKIGVSKDIFYELLCDKDIFKPERFGEIDREQLEMLVDKYLADGIQWKYDTVKDWENKKNYINALAD